MESSQLETNEQTKQTKKPRAPRKSKLTVETKTIEQVQDKKIEEPEELKKQHVIVGIDPGFKKLGLAVLSTQDQRLLKTICLEVRPDKQKMTQTQVEGYICNNIKKLMNNLYEEFDIDYIVIELQLGNFSCTAIQTCLVANIRDETPFTIQHSKLKLKHAEISQVQNTNTESKQYNQNKMIGRLLAQYIFKDQQFNENNYDQCDALLHALYVYRNKDKIQFIKKIDLINQ